MPAEVSDVDEFVKISERAEYCAVKRLNNVVKLKLRTPRRLYTMSIEPVRVDEIVKKLKCKVTEI